MNDSDEQDTFLGQGTQQLEQEPSRPRPYMPAAQHPQPAPQQQGQPPFGQVLASMLPWGMADQLDLQRHLAGLTQVEQDHSAGNLSDEDAQSATGAIMPRLQTLLQKQQKAQAQKMQQGVQAAMQGAALEEGVNAVHKQSRAGSFGKEIASLVDPVSGHRAYFTQDHKGDWAEVKFDHAHAEDDFLQQQNSQEGQEGGEEMGPFSQARGDTSADGGAPRGLSGKREGPRRPGSMEGQPGGSPMGPFSQAVGDQTEDSSAPMPAEGLQQLKQQAAQSGQPLNYQQVGHVMRAASRDPADFEQTIHSGQHTDKYRGGKLISTTRKPAASTGDAAVTEEQLKGMHEMARRAVGPLRQDAGPHERIAYDTQVHALVQSMLGRQQIAHEYRLRATERQDQVKLQRQLDSEEHQRQEGARSKEAERKEQQRLEDRAIDKQRHEQSEARKEYTGALEGIQKRHAAWTKDPLNEGKEPPDELKPENHDYHATRAAQRAIQRGRELSGSPDRPPGGKGGGTPAPGGDRGSPGAQARGAGDDIKKILTHATAGAGGNPGVVHEQVSKLLPAARNALFAAKNPGPDQRGRQQKPLSGKPLENLQTMHDVLEQAHQDRRPLSAEEIDRYARHHQEFDTALKNNGVKQGAEWLKLDAKPPEVRDIAADAAASRQAQLDKEKKDRDYKASMYDTRSKLEREEGEKAAAKKQQEVEQHKKLTTKGGLVDRADAYGSSGDKDKSGLLRRAMRLQMDYGPHKLDRMSKEDREAYDQALKLYEK